MVPVSYTVKKTVVNGPCLRDLQFIFSPEGMITEGGLWGEFSLAHLIQRFAQELFARTQQVAFLVLAVKFRTSKNLDESFFLFFLKKSIPTSVVGQLYFIVDMVDL